MDPQAIKLKALIRAAQAASGPALRGDLFASRAGHALVNAMFDLTEVDGLYTLAADVEHELSARDRRHAA